jgi:hypothetical protein
MTDADLTRVEGIVPAVARPRSFGARILELLQLRRPVPKWSTPCPTGYRCIRPKPCRKLGVCVERQP